MKRVTAAIISNSEGQILIAQHENGSIELLAYVAKPLGQRIKPVVHNAFRWVDKHEILEYDFAPADIPIVRRLTGTA